MVVVIFREGPLVSALTGGGGFLKTSVVKKMG